jgi:Zn ribbon nucleic-acid-binding protein
VYTFDAGNDLNGVLSKAWGDKAELKYFDYQFWNQGFSSAYKSFTKPNIEIGVGRSEFVFPLHFGRNQSRKYFWNKSRSQGNGLAHHIFDPASRLKISSMRLIRKHNSVNHTWEYYLSLAIYRLEEANTKLDLTQSKEIVGIDFGENQLAAFTHATQNGNFVSAHNFDDNLSKHALDLHNEIESQIETKNYADPINRQKLTNKLRSAIQQTSSQILKLNLENNIVVFEADATGNKKHIAKGKGNFKKNTLIKGFKLLERSKSKNDAELSPTQILDDTIPNKARINKTDILGLVPTQLTSSICSNCGYEHANETKNSFQDKLKTKVDLIRFKTDIKEGKMLDKIDIRDYIVDFSGQKSSQYESLFVVDLVNKIARIDNEAGITFKTEIDTFKSEYTKNQEAKLPKSILSLFSHRPKWFEGDVETFRCIHCGHVEYRSCDRQASLNIARWRVYLNSKNIRNFHFDKDNNESQFQVWYQEQLQKYGYDDNGMSNWNKSE